MKVDLWTILPQEIWINILGRLPAKSVFRCKFVCKSWGDMIEGVDFSESYIPKPCLCLAFGHEDTGYEVYDETCKPLFRFQLAQPAFTHKHSCVVIDSVDGLLFVWDMSRNYELIPCIVNPMTREYIRLSHLPIHRFIYGFGVSKLSGQYKILLGDRWKPRHVYTLGPEVLLRSIREEVKTCRLDGNGDAKFLNGNLHWLADYPDLVCCFDLETELLTTFSHPPRVHHGYRGRIYGGYGLFILEDLLCLCDISDDLHVVIWRMNNYGDANSWIKEYIFDQQPYISETGRPNILNYVLPLKVLENGDLLFTVNTDKRLFIYTKDADAVETYGLLQRSTFCSFSNIIIYRPTFRSLKSMGILNVGSSSFY
ncbi:putative F-box protein At1g33530 [Salvia hispanica]|uniref:putative F-box protein At1g33530 n=1 Tax=Salvia hispanica TaxID=49212 RepID=UPI00200901AA|nr:putative F-box protein At1g33530 [Salvia hispanica]